MAADGDGTRFGQYVLLRRIARGGMAEVFLAQQRGPEGFDRRVAVKRILPQLADAPDFIRMFLSEARVAAQLTHPNIVHIYDFGKVDEGYFIAMEYIEGVHAGQLLKLGESDRPPATLVARLGADAAAALHYAHELRGADGRLVGLVHRDVSPANLMVSFDGVVKLCDFGIAKAAAIGDQLTNPGQVKGKYAYMSPEQTTGTPLDGRSDVFSLGIVMWELMTGRTIVKRGDAVEAMRAIRDGRLMPIEQAAPWTPGPLAAAITSALQTRRARRPNAMQLAEQLEGFIKSSPELATPIQLGAWLRARFARDETEDVAGGTGSGGTGEHAGSAVQPSTGAHPSVITSDTTAELAAQDHGQGASASGVAPVSPGALASAGSYGVQFMPVGAVADSVQRAAHGASAPVHLPAQAMNAAANRGPGQAATAIPLKLPPQAATLIAAGRGDAALADGQMTGGRGLVSSPVAPTLLDPNAQPMSSTRGSPRVGVPALTAVPAAPGAASADRRRRARIALGLGGVLGFGALVLVIALAGRGTPEASWGGLEGARSGLAGDTAQGSEARLDDALPRMTAKAVRTQTATAPEDGSPSAMARGGTAQDGTAQDAAAQGASAHAGTTQDAAAQGAGAQGVTQDAGAVAAAKVDRTGGGTANRGAASTRSGDRGATTILEVRTRPDGATVRVAGHRQFAPALFSLPAGHYAIDAEAEGWLPERRSVDLVAGIRLVQDIVFTTPLHKERRVQTGKLSVRTTPPCEVYLGTRRLTETPFTDMEFEPATYTLVFKHPRRQAVIKHVTITAGKTTRLSFALP